MKKFALYFFLSFPIVCNCQLTTEQVNFDYQIAYCVGNSASTAWIGESVVVMIENELPSDRDTSVMKKIIQTFENIILKFEELTELNNLPMASSYQGKPVIEVVVDNCGAGGLANHGTLGMSTGKPFLDEFYNLVSQGTISVPQVFLYELNRNFWVAEMDGFNGKFDWAMNDEPQNYGWWTVGMNNAQAYIIPKSLNIGLYYFGYDINYWETRMVNELEDYMEDTQYDFDYGWRQSLMPWHNTESINDLMTGLIIYSYNNFGGDEWIKGFYKQIQNDEIINRSDVFAYQECRDNIYKIWSLAATQDLVSFFEDELRWTVSQEAKICVTNELNSTNTNNTSIANFAKVYPNPSTNVLSIENKSNSIAEIYTSEGRRIKKYQLEKGTSQIDISSLLPGIYFIKVNNEMHKFIKK